MWKSFMSNESDPAIYLRVEIIDDNTKKTATPEDRVRYSISVTNYIKLWNGIFDNKGITKLMSDSNKGTETNDKQGFLHAGLRMLHNPKLVDKKVFFETPKGYLRVSLTCTGPIVLKFNFTLIPSSPERFYLCVVRPLLVVINDQRNSEKKLRRLLMKKDQEMHSFMNMLPEESIIRRVIKSSSYKDEEHMKTHDSMAKLFGTDPELRVCPRHIILHGRSLPVLPTANVITKKTPSFEGTPKEEPLIPVKLIKTEPLDVIKGEPTDAGTSGIHSPTQAAQNPVESVSDNQATPDSDTQITAPDLKSENVTQDQSDHVTQDRSDQVKQVQSDHVTQVQSDQVKQVQSDQVTQDQSDQVTQDPSDQVTQDQSDQVTQDPSDQVTQDQSGQVTQDQSVQVTQDQSDKVTQDPTAKRRALSPGTESDAHRLKATTPKKMKRSLNY